jgi:hypothetical protein
VSKDEKLSDDNKALVKRLFDEVSSTENVAAADDRVAGRGTGVHGAVGSSSSLAQHRWSSSCSASASDG